MVAMAGRRMRVMGMGLDSRTGATQPSLCCADSEKKNGGQFRCFLTLPLVYKLLSNLKILFRNVGK